MTLLIAHPDDLIRMKTAAAEVRDRPVAKRRQDLDDIAVLERLRSGSAQAEQSMPLTPKRTSVRRGARRDLSHRSWTDPS